MEILARTDIGGAASSYYGRALACHGTVSEVVRLIEENPIAEELNFGGLLRPAKGKGPSSQVGEYGGFSRSIETWESLRVSTRLRARHSFWK